MKTAYVLNRGMIYLFIIIGFEVGLISAAILWGNSNAIMVIVFAIIAIVFAHRQLKEEFKKTAKVTYMD